MIERLERKQDYIMRSKCLCEKVVFVDGLGGCGKTMLSPIIAALDRAELLTYAYEIEHICSLYFLNKIDRDAAVAMVKMLTDLQLYNTMMAREVNFRPSDLSSVFRDAHPVRYLKRLFKKGDEVIPDRIRQERPILHLTTHNLLFIAEPIFAGLGEKAVFIELVRHPLYMVIQQEHNMRTVFSDARDFTVYFKHDDRELPFFVNGWEDLFLRSNDTDKAIYCMEHLAARTEAAKKMLAEKYNAQILTVPFESFVIDPWPYMDRIKDLLRTKLTHHTLKMMKKQKVPRKMYAEGINLKVYKRYGFRPPEAGSSESGEIRKRWQFAEQRASKKALGVLHDLCKKYEENYAIRF